MSVPLDEGDDFIPSYIFKNKLYFWNNENWKKRDLFPSLSLSTDKQRRDRLGCNSSQHHEKPIYSSKHILLIWNQISDNLLVRLLQYDKWLSFKEIISQSRIARVVHAQGIQNNCKLFESVSRLDDLIINTGQ